MTVKMRWLPIPLCAAVLSFGALSYAEPETTTTTTTKKKVKSDGEVETKTKTKTVTKGGDHAATDAPPAGETSAHSTTTTTHAAGTTERPVHHTKHVTAQTATTTDDVRTDKTDKTTKTEKPVAADNTAKNDADRSREGEKPTADQAKNDKSDVTVMAQIRRSVMADKELSTSAHNVKIIAESGMVTLKGPVKSSAEKETVARKAVEVVGAKNVRNELEIAP